MPLNLIFNCGRLLGLNEKLTTARLNAFARGITASITGQVGATDLTPGAVTAAVTAADAFWYSSNCTLVGTVYNVTGFPVALAALVPGMVLYFKPDQDNTGPVSLGLAPPGNTTQITKNGGKPLAAGDIKAHRIVGVQYNNDLLGAPTWELLNATANSVYATQVPVTGSARNLVVKNNAASPTTKVDITADELMLKDPNGVPYLATAVNLTANVGVIGANGLDAGAVAAATWYYVWVIYDATGNTVASLLSTSATAPTMPGNYTFKAMIGTVHAGVTGGGASDFMPFYQMDRDVWIQEQAVFTNKTGVTAWTATAGADLTALQALIPPIAKQASGNMGCSANQHGGIAVAADANGMGANAVGTAATINVIQSLNVAGGWRCPILTPQTLYYIMDHLTANTYRLSVNGYRI